MKSLRGHVLAALVLTAVLLLGLMLGAQAEIVDSGTCGTNATWTLDENGLLTISGEGGHVGLLLHLYSLVLEYY